MEQGGRAARGGENEEEAGGQGRATNFFNGIFKDGFKLEVISVFMLERRKLKNCVSLCDFVNVHACLCM